MFKLTSFLQRSNSNDSNTDDSDRKKLDEFHESVSKYIKSGTGKGSDIYDVQILNCLQCFVRQSGVPPSIEKDLTSYLKKSLPIFTAEYHKYYTQIMRHYHLSFIGNQDDQKRRFSLLGNHDFSNDDEEHSLEYKSLESASVQTILYMDTLYDLITKSDTKISLAKHASIKTEILSVIVALAHLSLSDEHNKNIWDDINLSLKLFTALVQYLPLETIRIFQHTTNTLSYWKILCNFIKHIIQNSDNQQKLWILAERLLKLILHLIESDIDALSQIFIEQKLLHYLRDIIESNLIKSKQKLSNKVHHLIFRIHRQV